jgi:sodium/potassium-transporting ATPase subunit alpha
MLWIGSLLCVFAYFAEPSQGLGNVYLAAVLIIVIILTGSITYMQTSKSEALMEGFKSMIPNSCSITRDGQPMSVDPIKLVPGDVISVKAGDKIPADIRVIQSIEMKVDNSALTGEADPLLRLDKCTNDNVLETANMAFFGTLCKEG